jgi:Flp pilus assembly protein TadD
VKQLAAIRLYDLIDSVGIDGFLAREKEYFKKLTINPDVRFFGNMGEALEAAGDYDAWSKWMTLANSYFPNNTFLTMLTADSQLKLGNKQEARKLYQSARELALKEKNTGAIQAVDEKMKGL